MSKYTRKKRGMRIRKRPGKQYGKVYIYPDLDYRDKKRKALAV